jgi:hypothetical protein
LGIATPPATAQGQRAGSNLPPDLADVVAAWPDLPEHIKAAVLALLRTTKGV